MYLIQGYAQILFSFIPARNKNLRSDKESKCFVLAVTQASQWPGLQRTGEQQIPSGESDAESFRAACPN